MPRPVCAFPSPAHTSRARAAFTVLELLLVVILLAVLGSLILSRFGDVREGALVDAMMNDLRGYALAQEEYKAQTGSYAEAPVALGDFPSPGTSTP